MVYYIQGNYFNFLKRNKMKNIHIIPTDKPSRLHLESNGLKLSRLQNTLVAQNIYITNSEEIKEGDWFIHNSYNCISIQKAIEVTNMILDSEGQISNKENNKKIILTTDQDLIEDGVQTIDDEFLKWFVKNPSCEEVEVEAIWFTYMEYKIIIPKEESKQEFPQFGTKEFNDLASQYFGGKQETLEEAVKNFRIDSGYRDISEERACKWSFIEGAKWQQEQIGKSEFLQKLRATLSDAEARRLIFETFKNK
jgi:hypothetical protein